MKFLKLIIASIVGSFVAAEIYATASQEIHVISASLMSIFYGGIVFLFFSCCLLRGRQQNGAQFNIKL